jgi:hypothetical protein
MTDRPAPIDAVDPDSITAETWARAHTSHSQEACCGPDGCEHQAICQQCAAAGRKGWDLAWPCQAVLGELGLSFESDYCDVEARLVDEAIAARRSDPLARARPGTRVLILAHAAAPVVAAVRAGHLRPSRVASLIRTVLPSHKPGTCPACQAITS